jgi:hypothetical protein
MRIRVLAGVISVLLVSSIAQADPTDEMIFAVFSDNGGFSAIQDASDSGDTYTVFNLGSVSGSFPFANLTMEEIPGLPVFGTTEFFIIGSYLDSTAGDHIMLSNVAGETPSSIGADYQAALVSGARNFDSIASLLASQGGFATGLDAEDFWDHFIAHDYSGSGFTRSDYADIVNQEFNPFGIDLTPSFSSGTGVAEITMYDPTVIGELTLTQGPTGSVTPEFQSFAGQNPVPEPGPLALALAAVPVLWWHRRRRRLQR